MTQKEIADYYSRLLNGEKGRFTAFLSMTLGGSPHTWQQKILGWTRNIIGRSMSAVVGATDKPCGVRTVANPKQLLNGT